ncbi:hypothetical protein [Micromonospora sp. RTGN7]|uniref:hypothetical protein n=1 Tax=Micromonospora sp. RTGN7 TaxID=3016526 RepID=UPI0029FF1B88|nr:hypothetical protein [Micromonospora sp. RTGN7]
MIRWEAPPPPLKRGPSPGVGAAMRRAAIELRARPGRWAVVVEGAGTRTLVTRIRQASDQVWGPPGSYEAVCRLVDGCLVVYARYVGSGA